MTAPTLSNARRADAATASTGRKAGRRVSSDQIKTRERVRDLAEVFTHEREVDAMLDLIPEMFADVDTRFLEPACGAGNFLVEIITRKLKLVSSLRYRSQSAYEFRVLRCLTSVYGIDISADNIVEAHDRIRHVVLEHFAMDANTWVPTAEFLRAMTTVLTTNILRADTMRDANDIVFVEYSPGPRQTFVRTPSPLIEAEQDLFFTAPQPLPPIHYSELGALTP